MTPLNLIHYAKCFFALEYFSKDSPSLLLKAEIVTFACLSYYVTCHMKIYQSNFRDFFVFLGIMLVFPLSYPHRLIPLGITLVFCLPYPYRLTSLGITLVFRLPYPYCLTSLGITLVFSSPMPTTSILLSKIA